MHKNKLIFIDVDGVLNNPGDFQNRIGGYPLNPAMIARLVKLVKDTGAGLVVSSSWRYSPDALKTLYDTLLAAGCYQADFVGETPRLDDNFNAGETYGEHRTREIHRFIDNYCSHHDLDAEPVCVAFDDVNLGDDFAMFIQTDGAVGLTDKQCEIAKNWLNA